MNWELLDELIEKWEDVITHTDDFEEQTLASEFIDDLKLLKRG
jgi:hypothetical protein